MTRCSYGGRFTTSGGDPTPRSQCSVSRAAASLSGKAERRMASVAHSNRPELGSKFSPHPIRTTPNVGTDMQSSNPAQTMSTAVTCTDKVIAYGFSQVPHPWQGLLRRRRVSTGRHRLIRPPSARCTLMPLALHGRSCNVRRRRLPDGLPMVKPLHCDFLQVHRNRSGHRPCRQCCPDRPVPDRGGMWSPLSIQCNAIPI